MDGGMGLNGETCQPPPCAPPNNLPSPQTTNPERSSSHQELLYICSAVLSWVFIAHPMDIILVHLGQHWKLSSLQAASRRKQLYSKLVGLHQVGIAVGAILASVLKHVACTGPCWWISLCHQKEKNICTTLTTCLIFGLKPTDWVYVTDTSHITITTSCASFRIFVVYNRTVLHWLPGRQVSACTTLRRRWQSPHSSYGNDSDAWSNTVPFGGSNVIFFLRSLWKIT